MVADLHVSAAACIAVTSALIVALPDASGTQGSCPQEGGGQSGGPPKAAAASQGRDGEAPATNAEDHGVHDHQKEEEIGSARLTAEARGLAAELQGVTHKATAYTEEALRGLLYCVLVRHLVVGIAGGGDGAQQEAGEAQRGDERKG